MQSSSGCDGSVIADDCFSCIGTSHSGVPSADRSFATYGPVSVAKSQLPSLVHCGLEPSRIVAKAAVAVGRHSGQKARFWNAFNDSVKWHCDRIPSIFSSSSLEAFGKQERNSNSESNDNNGNAGATVADKKKRVLILMTDTGGGHRASAEALKSTFELEYGDIYEVTITDLWTDHTPWPFNQLPKSYSFLVKHSTLWKATFHVTAPRFIHQPHFAFTSVFIARKVMRGLLKYRPDIIVSVHPLMQHVPIRLLRARGLLKKIPFTTVVTDLSTGHPTWFHRLVTRCYCPSKEVAERATKAGLKPSQIRVFGLPIRPSFCRPVRPKDELKMELGMNNELPAVLLMGGGEGMGPVEATAKALGKSLYDMQSDKPIGQLVVICGRNKKLIKRLEDAEWSIPVKIKGFQTNMEEWMAACDCIITKAGPGTIAEALIRGLPLLLNDYIAGQRCKEQEEKRRV
ncbi:hypothetical protein KP509_22G080200 [Ceratopteris richardii]|uniref:monogalactosyldiacylglycerol synthase n=1 Tax=Ceratopteris richardii TaxID=49495 RepID=A0A8T2S6V4_CERRI|nr:hypothetical protein KP509_22G080200 [Ceratopteris richardii]